MKRAGSIYLKNGVEPSTYGFVETNGGWIWEKPGVRCGLKIERGSMRISPTLAFSMPVVMQIIRMAEDHAIEIDARLDRPYLYRLTHEEVLAIEKMRGHPKEDLE